MLAAWSDRIDHDGESRMPSLDGIDLPLLPTQGVGCGLKSALLN